AVLVALVLDRSEELLEHVAGRLGLAILADFIHVGELELVAEVARLLVTDVVRGRNVAVVVSPRLVEAAIKAAMKVIRAVRADLLNARLLHDLAMPFRSAMMATLHRVSPQTSGSGFHRSSRASARSSGQYTIFASRRAGSAPTSAAFGSA